MKLGPGAFETVTGEVVKAALVCLSQGAAFQTGSGLLGGGSQKHIFRGLDVATLRSPADKAASLIEDSILSVDQTKQLDNPDAVIRLTERPSEPLLSELASVYHGISTTDYACFGRYFWELPTRSQEWVFQQSTIRQGQLFAGKENILLWEDGRGELKKRQKTKAPVVITGLEAWGKLGIAITQMGHLPATLYLGTAFDDNTAVIVPHLPEHLLSMWSFCSSKEYHQHVRDLDQTLKVTYPTLVKVPFDLESWTKIAQEKYPNGLPKPYSNDPTQWIFHGHPAQSEEPLQVAVARLLGYRWPAELDPEMELSEEARAWIKRSKSLDGFADKDDIVCIPPVRGEMAAADRLLRLLVEAYNGAPNRPWTDDTLAQLLSGVGYADKSLESWLRDGFFAQHCKLFRHRPFIWHVWDGLRDGFAALVNYHKLEGKLLETLIYTYLGDWISRQKQDIASGVDGAEEKLAAAEALKGRLELILEGEAPYDIFVRWKPLARQPIGWAPDLNDGVRLNIRPFMSVQDVGRKGAGVLRDKPNIDWAKDRGKDVETAPWFSVFRGERLNDHHLKLKEKL